MLVVPGLERLGEQERERLQLRAVRTRLEQRLGAREHREQVHDVVLGVVLDRQVLLLERGGERLAEEFADIGDGQEFGITASFGPLPCPILQTASQLSVPAFGAGS